MIHSTVSGDREIACIFGGVFPHLNCSNCFHCRSLRTCHASFASAFLQVHSQLPYATPLPGQHLPLVSAVNKIYQGFLKDDQNALSGQPQRKPKKKKNVNPKTMARLQGWQCAPNYLDLTHEIRKIQALSHFWTHLNIEWKFDGLDPIYLSLKLS